MAFNAEPPRAILGAMNGDEPEYAPTYTREERVRNVLIALAVGGAVIFVCNFLLFPKLLMLVNHVECQTVYGFSGVAVVMYSVFVGLPLSCAVSLGAFIVPRSVASIRTRQYPAPGRKVNRPIRIRRGRAAVLQAWLDISFIGFFVAIAIWGSFQAGAISRQAAHTHMDCVRVPEPR
jgi:hypothetical protein